MKAKDVAETLNLALQASGLNQVHVVHPLLLSDNGSSYISGDLAKWLGEHKITNICGTPCHPQTQGKIERWHQTLKNRITLDNYYFPSQLEAEIGGFVDYYNNRRYHQSLNNLTPADVYFGHALKRETRPWPGLIPRAPGSPSAARWRGRGSKVAMPYARIRHVGRSAFCEPTFPPRRLIRQDGRANCA